MTLPDTGSTMCQVLSEGRACGGRIDQLDGRPNLSMRVAKWRSLSLISSVSSASSSSGSGSLLIFGSPVVRLHRRRSTRLVQSLSRPAPGFDLDYASPLFRGLTAWCSPEGRMLGRGH